MPEGKIKVLSEVLSNKIAAGEVIDRPAAVVKELVENAIDAGATEITIIVRDGGKSLIHIVDNGSGMVESDAILAFERHSTSKISTVEDLSRIHTMGFRGEALASIGSVSRVEVKTRVGEEDAATHLILEGGVIKHLGKIAGNVGSSIAVKNLFFNTPARRKFLKSDLAEYRHIIQVAIRYFLSYPEITFYFYKNDSRVYNLPATDQKSRIVQLFGEKFRKNLLSVDYELPTGRLHGYIGNMDLFRQSRGDQFLFLNRRYIVNRNVHFAVIRAYESMLPQGSYPFYCLFLDIPPESVDVNVHPSKIEVRFEDERAVFSLVHRGVREALQNDAVIPTLGMEHSAKPEMTTISMEQYRKMKRQHSPGGQTMAFPFEFRKNKRQLSVIKRDDEELVETESSPADLHHEPEADHVSVWQLHNKYIFSQIKSGLIIIDQHLAHERILYEKALRTFEHTRASSQQQLFPKAVQLAPEDFEVLLEMQYYLTRLGFVVREFGQNTVIIEAVPAELGIHDEEAVLREMIDDFKQNKDPDIREKVAKAYSCKSAIKAGDRLKTEEIVSLIDGLFATENPYFCPHGRPIIVTIPMEELDKRFLRI